jgi:flagellar biosynthesis protein FlhF
MRLRTFTASNMSEAMALVRSELGADAIIVSADTADGVTSVIAAVETEDAAPPGGDAFTDAIHAALVNHAVLPRLSERLVIAAASLGADTEVRALGAALGGLFRFKPIGSGHVALVGPPGSGKSLTAAKLATRAVLAGDPVQVITTDTVRAGATEQLASLTRILGIELLVAGSPDELRRFVAAAPTDELVLIDTPGTNPYVDDELAELAGFIDAASAEPVLVLAAGGDVYDTVEMARSFAAIGCRRLVPTRVDMAHRLGALLSAADAAQLAFAEIGISASVADGLKKMSPVALARLLLPDPPAREPGADKPALDSVQVAS